MTTKVQTHIVLPFTSAPRSTPQFHSSAVLPFAVPKPPPSRCGAARLGHSADLLAREDAKWNRAQALWLKAEARADGRTPASGDTPSAGTAEITSAPTAPAKARVPIPTPPRPPDLRLFFNTVTERRGVHPLWRVFKTLSRVYSGFFRVLQPVISGYFLIVTIVTVPFALVAGQLWLGGFCALIGLAFARILLAQVQGWRVA